MVLSWEQLRLVLALARHGTLSGAARALRVSPDALEAELKTAERAAGAALFVREGGRLLPTDAGRSALHTGERMAEEMARVERTLPRVPPGPPVRVRVEGMLAGAWLQAAAADLARTLGSVTLELVTAGRNSELEVTAHPRPTRGSTRTPLGLTADALYASEPYVLDHGRPGGAESLVGHRVVVLTGAAGRTPAGRWLVRASTSGAEVALRTDSPTVLVAGVQAGVGLGVLPEGLEDVFPELIRIAPLPELPVRTLWLVRRGVRSSARVRRAAQVLEQTLSLALRRWQRA